MPRFALPLLLAGAALSQGVPAFAAGPGPRQTRAEYTTRIRESKAREREWMAQDAKQRMATARRWAAAARAAQARGEAPPAASPWMPIAIHEDGARVTYEVDVHARRYATHVAANAPVNLRVGDAPGDSTRTIRSASSIAASGNQVLIAWSEDRGPAHFGCGLSSDGGQSYRDGGMPPLPPEWFACGDPVVTVNENTGTFYLCVRVEPNGATNGIAVMAATVAGDTLSWSTPVLARSASSTAVILDQPGMVADSTGGNLYLTYRTFDATTGDHIDFQRSTDGGATWSSPTQLSSRADNGGVQGARPAVGPAGELYVVWSAIGGGPEDHIRFRRSMSRGHAWDAEVTPAAVYFNFGTGAPGWNREGGIDLPAIAVDRSRGTNRGRVHLAWTECMNRYDDALNTRDTRVERENDDYFSRATPFTPGQRLRGALGRGDRDYFSFSAREGTSYLFECDSVPNPLYTLRLFCGRDTTTRLAFTGDVTAPAGGRGYLLWTAPAPGIYYLRMAALPGGRSGGYRISTGVARTGLERARDARDVFAAHSDDGATWSEPALATDAAPRYAEYLPDIAVAADGMPYVSWLDWRDDRYGGKSYRYVTRSTDGGDAWGTSQRFSDAQNHWTNLSLASDLAPDMGSYAPMCVDGGYLRPAWTDGRDGAPDVYTERIATGFSLTACQGDLASNAGSSIDPGWTVANLNPLFASPYSWTLMSQRNWPSTGSGTVTAVADGSVSIGPSVTIPDSAATGTNQICLMVRDARDAQTRLCCFNVTIQPAPMSVPILASDFDLQASQPNPATHQTRIDFSLPSSGPVRLRIYGMKGELVRTLADGERPAGPNSVTWDGRDDRGSTAGAGAYMCRLEGFGSVRVQRLIWIR